MPDSINDHMFNAAIDGEILVSFVSLLKMSFDIETNTTSTAAGSGSFPPIDETAGTQTLTHALDEIAMGGLLTMQPFLTNLKEPGMASMRGVPDLIALLIETS